MTTATSGVAEPALGTDGNVYFTESIAGKIGRLNPATGAFALANAGLPDPYLLAAGKPARALAAPGPRLPVGIRSDVLYRSLSLTLAPGDRVLAVQEGFSAMTSVGHTDSPIDAAVVGVIDAVELA